MRKRSIPLRTIGVILALALPASQLFAKLVEYDLTLANQSVNITGTSLLGMTINGDIPGPTLRFTEGDTARIHVTNTMNEPSSIHWHGLLVPPEMDGVPFISFPPIAVGATFTYEFPIRQAGTYWYHSHSALQEQSGIYGSIVITPQGGDSRYPELKEHVLMLSDWTDEDPHEVMRTLRSGNEFYSLRKRSGQSILGAIRARRLKEYFSRELQRMPAMDISDVAYDRYLVNGRSEENLAARVGERIRLRLINGAATTYFHVEFAGGPMTIIAADGQDVEPVEVERLLIGVAETYDVLVTVPAHGRFELRATSHDRAGRTSLWLGSGPDHPAPLVPVPDLYTNMGGLSAKRVFALTPTGTMGMTQDRVDAGELDQPGMNMGDMKTAGMSGMNMTKTISSSSPDAMDHGTMNMTMKTSPTTPMSSPRKPMEHAEMAGRDSDAMPMKKGQSMPLIVAPPGTFDWLAGDLSSQGTAALEGSVERPWSPYASLRATHPTAPDPSKPVRDIRLTLDGDMERYVWFINNAPLSASDSIRVNAGEVVRFIMVNRTMMHHPMHLHGHFFRVINGQGDYSPLKHTVDVEPMSTTVIEFAADEKGDWFFHCHLLYHVKAGMARVVQYDDFDAAPETAAVRSQIYADPYYVFGRGAFTSQMSTGWAEFSNNLNIFRGDWELGWDNVPDPEWEGIATYGRYVNRFTTVFAGADFLGEKSTLEETRGIAGLSYTLPFNFYTRTWVDTEGEARAAVAREFILTPRLALELDAEYDTGTLWEGAVALDYVLTKRTAIQVRWHSDFKWGAGVRFLF